MPSPQPQFRYRVLIVDDEDSVRATMQTMLTEQGYDVLVAADGFEALALMRGALPDLILSDLKMPNMSGFELLGIIRKRFPSIAVVAMSAEFRPATSDPELLVDRYIAKGETPPLEIVEIIRELLASSPLRSQPAKSELAAVWVPQSKTRYLVLTCPECLRSFSVRALTGQTGRFPDERCPHCEATVQYCVDITITEEPSGTSPVAEMRKQVQSSERMIEISQGLIRSRKDRTP